jgi:hypothetical protein
MSDIEHAEITIDYYQGAYGPTIRLVLPTDDSARRLWEIFLALSRGEATSAALHEMPNMKISGFKHLMLSVRPVDDSEKTLTFVDDNDTRVNWSRSREGWANAAILVKALIDYHQPAHQYLTTEGFDDALIEVAYKE